MVACISAGAGAAERATKGAGLCGERAKTKRGALCCSISIIKQCPTGCGAGDFFYVTRAGRAATKQFVGGGNVLDLGVGNSTVCQCCRVKAADFGSRYSAVKDLGCRNSIVGNGCVYIRVGASGINLEDASAAVVVAATFKIVASRRGGINRNAGISRKLGSRYSTRSKSSCANLGGAGLIQFGKINAAGIYQVKTGIYQILDRDFFGLASRYVGNRQYIGGRRRRSRKGR